MGRRRILWGASLLALAGATLIAIVVGLGIIPHGTPRIIVEGQEARFSPVILGVGSIFMRIENSGNGGDTLIKARAGIPGAIVELHDVEDGRMVKREKFEIPSRDIVEMKPRGPHIMVFNIPRNIKAGDEFRLYLTFKRSGEKEVPVRFAGTSG